MEENKILSLNAEELKKLTEQLKLVYDIVRVTDPLQKKQFEIDCDGCLQCDELKCYMMWNREVNTKCENCSSSRAVVNQSKETKFEFMNDEIYQVVSQYIEVDGQSMVLEMMNHIVDESLMDANGSNSAFVESITKRNKIMFHDSLTGANNRRCYEEQIRLTHLLCGVAMIDVDNFKGVNDTFGHAAGDAALKAIVDACRRHTIEARDTVIRFGGDEFIVVCRGIPVEAFSEILENIRKDVEKMEFADYPELHLTLSLGGAHGVGTVNDMLYLADHALYESKVGKNQSIVRLYSEEEKGELTSKQ